MFLYSYQEFVQLFSVSRPTHHAEATSRTPSPGAGCYGNEGQRPPAAGFQGQRGSEGFRGEGERRKPEGQRKKERKKRSKEKREGRMKRKRKKRGAHWRNRRLWSSLVERTEKETEEKNSA